MNVFTFVNSISYDKKNYTDEELEKEYVPFIINKAFSNFPDTVLFANEMNKFPLISKRNQYEYYLNSIKPRKRFSKWYKKIDNEKLQLVKDYFKVSDSKANEIVELLTEQDYEQIKQKLETGGIRK